MKPCPGCGKTDNLLLRVIHITYWNDSKKHFVKCKCGWTGPDKKTQEEAIKAWDKRYGNNK